MAPDYLEFGDTFHPGGGDVFLAQLLQHETAGHAADIGDGVVAEDGRRQDDVRQRIAENLEIPCDQAVDQDHAGYVRHHILEEDIEPSRPADPAKHAVEHQQADQAEPEDRHGIPEEAQHADDLIRPAALVDCGDDTHGDTENDAEHGGDGRQLQGCWKHPDDILRDRSCGQQGGAEIAPENIADVVEKLDIERLIQTHRLAGGLIDFFARLVADNGERRIDRHDAADDEGDKQQPDEGDGDGCRCLQNGPQKTRGEKHRSSPCRM